MDLQGLKPSKGSVSLGKRIARGEGSGRGGTATRGHNGAKSRSGYSKKLGFEGGQMPLQRRVPKFGFTNRNRKEYQPINLNRIQALVDAGKLKDTLDIQQFIDLGLIGKRDRVKVVASGELKASLKVTAHGFSKTAKAAIEKQGGTTTVI